MIKEAMEYDNKFIHSIFSSKRKQEINSAFNSENTIKVIAAWGVSTKLNKLINLALENNNV